MNNMANTRIESPLACSRPWPINLDLYEGFESEPTGFIRVYHYPCSLMFGSGEESPGMVPHTDSSVVAILLQNDASGLEVQKDGRWILVNPVPGGLVVNLGDMMQALSNDGYKSVSAASEQISICWCSQELQVQGVSGTTSRQSVLRSVGIDRFKLDVVTNHNQPQTQIGSSA